MTLLLPGGTGASAQNVGPVLNSRQQVLPQAPRRSDGDIWASQDRLIGQSIAQLPERAASGPNIYAVAIAPLGTQTLFSREAKVALSAFATNFGGTAKGGILLSNFDADHKDAPLATQQNIARVLAEIGRKTQAHPDDVVVIYLTSHGGQDASLQTEIPRNLPIYSITAGSMATALEQAHIGKRVIIVSACFAGTWIPRLANDDTIVIAAAAANRTSFGCADDRPLTYFGEAFLTGPFAQGASLEDSFEGARATVTKWEADEQLLNSLPQVYVGKNMEAFWQKRLRPAPAPAPRKGRRASLKCI